MDHAEFAQLLGNYGEFIGALAVVGTLIYLAVQIREARRAIIAQSYQFRSDAVSDLQIQIAQSEPILESLERLNSISTATELSETDFRRSYLVHRAIMNQLDNTCFQFGQGFVTQEVLDDTLRSARFYQPDWEKLGVDLRPALASALRDRR